MSDLPPSDLPPSDLAPVAALLKTAPARIDHRVILDYDARLMRRKLLRTDRGAAFMVDLPAVTNLDEYWGFELADGQSVAIVPAEETVLVITGDLSRLAWHIGNRHTPCEIGADCLVIREDPVLERMVRGLGGAIARATRPFRPEKGAYGTGRTMGHQHLDDMGHLHG